jgi:hypothetical protein
MHDIEILTSIIFEVVVTNAGVVLGK